MNLILRLSAGDAIISEFTRILNRTRRYTVITPTSELEKLAEMRRNETLIVVGHGDPNTIDGLTPTQLAAMLAKGGLRGPVNIELFSCNTGWGGAPFALNLKVELVQAHKIMCSCSAPTGYKGVQDDGVPYVTWDEDGTQDKPAEKAHYATTKSF